MGFSLLKKVADETLVMFRMTPIVMKNKNIMQFLQMKMHATMLMKKIIFFFN